MNMREAIDVVLARWDAFEPGAFVDLGETRLTVAAVMGWSPCFRRVTLQGWGDPITVWRNRVTLKAGAKTP